MVGVGCEHGGEDGLQGVPGELLLAAVAAVAAAGGVARRLRVRGDVRGVRCGHRDAGPSVRTALSHHCFTTGVMIVVVVVVVVAVIIVGGRSDGVGGGCGQRDRDGGRGGGQGGGRRQQLLSDGLVYLLDGVLSQVKEEVARAGRQLGSLVAS